MTAVRDAQIGPVGDPGEITIFKPAIAEAVIVVVSAVTWLSVKPRSWT